MAKTGKSFRVTRCPRRFPAKALSPRAIPASLIFDKRDIYFVTGGSAARVFHSPDLGRTWTVTDTPILKGNASWGAFSIARLGSVLVVVGGDFKDEADEKRTAAYSLDGGVTWTLATRPPTGFRSAVAFLNRRHAS